MAVAAIAFNCRTWRVIVALPFEATAPSQGLPDSGYLRQFVRLQRLIGQKAAHRPNLLA